MLSVLMAWTAEDGSDRYARGKCRDISPAGIRVETIEAIPVQTNVNLRIEKWDLTSSARVRYTRRAGMSNVVGLELTQSVRQQLLDSLQAEPPTS
jgi:hypothetical protein